MNTLSITFTRTMTYCAIAADGSFGVVEKLASVPATLLRAASKVGSVSIALALRVRA